MNKVLLIEDRLERQERFISDTNINLNDELYKNLNFRT